MISIAQREYADAYRDPLSTSDTLDRMEELFIARRRGIVSAKNKRSQLDAFERRHLDEESRFADRSGFLQNQLTQAEVERARVEMEIVEVARLIVAEDAAKEILAIGDTE